MIKGVIIGIILSSLILIFCYFLLGYGADMCNPGIGFLLSPLILLTTIIFSIVFYKHKSIVISTIAKTTLAIISLALIIFITLFFL